MPWLLWLRRCRRCNGAGEVERTSWRMWVEVERDDFEVYEEYFSKICLARQVFPDRIWECDGYVALLYHERCKFARLMVRRLDHTEISLSWSEMQNIVRGTLGDVTAIECYPSESETVNTAHVRHLWILPMNFLPSFIDMRDIDLRESA